MSLGKWFPCENVGLLLLTTNMSFLFFPQFLHPLRQGRPGRLVPLELPDVFPDREGRFAGSIFLVNREPWKMLLGAGALLRTSGLCQFPGTSGDLAWLRSRSQRTASLDRCSGAEPRLLKWTGAVSEQLPSVTRE